MAKSNGLGMQLYVDGYAIGDDTKEIGEIGGGPAALDYTPITKSAMVRIGGQRDGRMNWTAFFNPSNGETHDVLGALPTSGRYAMGCIATTIGSPAASLYGKQINYDPTRPQDGSLSVAVNVQGDGYGLEWGELLTAAPRHDTAATDGSGVEFPGQAYLQLPGSSGNTATTPDAAALDIVGDIDIRAHIAADDWTPAADSAIVAKFLTTGNQRSYSLLLSTAGALVLAFSTDGTAVISKTSTANLSALAAGASAWVRATMDVDNGASGYTVRFYTSTDGTTWTQLGLDVVTATATSIHAGTAVLELGSRNGGTTDLLAGKVFEAEVRTGIGGTAVAHPVATTSGITDLTGLVWTVNGTASLSNRTVHGLQAYLHVVAFTGADATIKLQESSDNGATDTWTDVVGGAFTAVTTGPQAQRIQTARGLTVERYLRVVSTTSGGFTSLVFVVAAVKNETEVLL
ncbi:hypothetical protein [Actinosynnema sp. NPDC023587]|uniref:hypothetical protein n=1 Tax=Actinosynnema sp. NPDC023587 TaxID=3154695 RepID=UPI0033E2EB23